MSVPYVRIAGCFALVALGAFQPLAVASGNARPPGPAGWEPAGSRWSERSGKSPRPQRRAKSSGPGGSSPFDAMIDVGGYKLHINCMGQIISGGPTVVLEAGLADTSRTWSRVEPAVGGFCRVCSYDRAGLGASEPAPVHPRTSDMIVNDLHTLLQGAGIRRPIVLVGHSFGGLIVRMYASTYSKDVAGMVLVDSVHEDETANWISLIPPEVRREMEAAGAGRVLGGEIDLKVSQDQMRAANWRTRIPLIVLSRGRASYNPDDYPPRLRELAPKGEELRIKMQAALAALSTHSKHVFAEHSGHMIQEDQPELVIESIRHVVEATRLADTRKF